MKMMPIDVVAAAAASATTIAEALLDDTDAPGWSPPGVNLVTPSRVITRPLRTSPAARPRPDRARGPRADTAVATRRRRRHADLTTYLGGGSRRLAAAT